MMYENDGPYGPMARPNFVISGPGACDLHNKLWDIVAQHYGVPVFRFETPFRFNERASSSQVQWVVSEFKRLIAFIEEHFNAKMDYGEFKQKIEIEAKVRELYARIQNYRKHIPCPYSLRETAGDIFYLLDMPATQEALDYFSLLLNMVKTRVERKVGVVSKERFRIYYDNVPVWYWLEMYEYLNELGAPVVFDTISSYSFAGDYMDGVVFDTDKPFECLAYKQLHFNMFLNVELIIERIVKGVKEWHCDGAILFDNRGCKVISSGNFEKVRAIHERCSVPTMVFEAEMADPRSLNEASVKSQIDTFMEMMAARKAHD